MYMTEGEICAMYRQAANPKDEITVLAQLNAVPAETIERILARNGYPVKVRKTAQRRPEAGKGIRLTEREREMVIQMWDAGYKGRVIAREMGCSEAAITRIVRKRWEQKGKGKDHG